MISGIMNKRITDCAKAFNQTKVTSFLAGRPTAKNDVFTDGTLTADLESFMNADGDINYSEIKDHEKNYFIHIIKSKLFAAQ